MLSKKYIFDVFVFFKALLIAPRQVGSILPSGRRLARLITSEISPRTGAVIELGPGTGVFTRALIARGVCQGNLALIESDPNLANRLRRQLSFAETFCMDAAQLDGVVLFNGRRAGAVISGLPMLSLPAESIFTILDGAFDKLDDTGAFYQFTYGRTCPVPALVLERLGLSAVCIGTTIANIPPAAVYRITRAQVSIDRGRG